MRIVRDRGQGVVDLRACPPPGGELTEQPGGKAVVGQRPGASPLVDELPPQAHMIRIGPADMVQLHSPHAVRQD